MKLIKAYSPTHYVGSTLSLLLFLTVSLSATAQNEVAIGSSTTKSNAILWLNGNGSQGLILPIVSSKSAVSPDVGMVVYDNSDNKVWYRTSSAWVEVGGGSSATSLGLQLQGNQLQLKDGTNVLSAVDLAAGTQANGAFMVFQGGAWQFATLTGDVTGLNGALQVGGIKGKSIAAFPATKQVLAFDPTANSGVGGWVFQTTSAGVGTVTSVTGGTGLTGGTITAAGTLAVDVGTTANKIVQLDGTGKLPAVDGSKLTNLPVASVADSSVTSAKIATRTITNQNISSTANIAASKLANTVVLDTEAPGAAGDISGNFSTGLQIKPNTIANADISSTAAIAVTKIAGGSNGQVLTTVGSTPTWSPASTGTVTSVIAGAGLTGGTITTSGTIAVDAGTTANKIVQLDGTGKLPAIDGSQLTNLPVGTVADGSITGGTAGAGVKIAATTITNANISATANIAASKLAVTVVLDTETPNATGDINGDFSTGLQIKANTIADADISSTAAIAGAKITPSFGAQNISTTGTVNTGAITTTNLASVNGVSYTWPNAQGASGTVLTNGGTGTLTWTAAFTNPMTTAGDIIFGGVSGASTRLAGGTGFLKSNGTTPGWSAVNLAATDVSGTLPIANGGTGATTAGAALTSLGALGTTSTAGGDLSGAFSNLQLVAGTILNADVNTSAAIDGSKITPTFGAQSLGVGTTNQFAINATGNITKINNIITSFPSAQGAANTVLSNNGAGTLSWVAPSGSWSLTGNAGTTPGTDFVGTTDVNALVIKTNSVENMRITAAGNVGIGTNNPGLKFEVAHNDPDGGMILNHTNVGNAKSEIRFSQNGVERWAIGNDYNRTGAQNFYIYDNDNLFPRFFIDPVGNVGIGTPAPGARLEVAGAVKIVDGTQAAGKVLTSDVNGLASWQPAGAGSAWSLTGNSGTVDGTNFIGTADNVPLSFRVNNEKAGRISKASKNTYFGYLAGANESTGTMNVAIGDAALNLNGAGDNNTAVGQGALFAGSGSNNSAVGQGALSNNVSGNNNTAMGTLALEHNSTGLQNTALGGNALNTVTNGQYNTAIGQGADVVNANASKSTAIGYNAKVGANNSLVLGGTGSDAVKVGIGTQIPNYTLEVVGNAGLSTGTAWINTSDRRIKTNVETVTDATAIIKRLRPVKFRYTPEWLRKYPTIKDHDYYSYIAQEFQEVFPESVQGSGKYLAGDPNEILSIDVSHAQIVAVKAIQELIEKVELLEKENEKLRTEKSILESKVSTVEHDVAEIKRMLNARASKN